MLTILAILRKSLKFSIAKITTVFDFTRPLGVFHQKKIVFWLPSIIDTIYGNALVTVFSYRWHVVYLFSEGFRVQDIVTILHVGCTGF